MRKFTKEQKKNIIQTKSNPKHIHTYVNTSSIYDGFEYKAKTDDNNNTKYYRWNAIDQEYNIPIQEWQTKQIKKRYYYYDVKVKNNIIQFHASRLYGDYNKFTRRLIACGSRMHHTYYWNTDTDNIKEVISTQKFKYKNGKRSVKTNTSFSNHSLLPGLELISDLFYDRIPKDKWLEILKTASITTTNCFEDTNAYEISNSCGKDIPVKSQLIITDDLIKEVINKWNSKSNIKIPKQDMLDMMGIITYQDSYKMHVSPYGNLNSLRRIKNPEEYIHKITKNYGKKIRKILYKEPYKAQFFNWLRKHETNIDVLRKYIENDYAWKVFYAEKPYIVKEINNSKIPNICIKWLFGAPPSSHNLKDTVLYMIDDINRMLKTIDKFNKTNELGIKFDYKIYPNDINKTEDNVIQAYNKIKEIPVKFMNYSIPYKNNTEWVMKTPDNSEELTEWGQKFHNCVGSYKNKILNNKSNIITMWDNSDNPVICIEINPNSKTIVQAFGPCNKNLGPESLKTLKNWGTYNGLTTDLCAYPQ